MLCKIRAYERLDLVTFEGVINVVGEGASLASVRLVINEERLPLKVAKAHHLLQSICFCHQRFVRYDEGRGHIIV